jgi:hypothetical protein
MKPNKMTNEALAQGLELWLLIEEERLFNPQKEYFEEIVWRLRLSDPITQEQENVENG